MIDMPFEDVADTREIALRLHPIDVGFDLRTAGMRTVLPDGMRLRVSYPHESGARYVLDGPRAAVVARLVSLGFRFANEGMKK